MREYILTLSCPDRSGIVSAVSGFLSRNNANIKSSVQYGDPVSKLFFMRVHFEVGAAGMNAETLLYQGFTGLAAAFDMDWQLVLAQKPARILILVSKFGHCLNDLVFRAGVGGLPVEIAGVVSNHDTFRVFCEFHRIPFYYLPVNAANRAEQEQAIAGIISGQQVDLLVLARYMQILSPAFCRDLYGKCINIHHSFLPSFSGASPYRQAYERGVKLIGATAHYVTEALDEGPIIDQDVARVDHAHTVEDLTAIGRDIECAVLARAVKHHAEHRILLNGNKTVVLR